MSVTVPDKLAFSSRQMQIEGQLQPEAYSTSRSVKVPTANVFTPGTTIDILLPKLDEFLVSDSLYAQYVLEAVYTGQNPIVAGLPSITPIREVTTNCTGQVQSLGFYNQYNYALQQITKSESQISGKRTTFGLDTTTNGRSYTASLQKIPMTCHINNCITNAEDYIYMGNHSMSFTFRLEDALRMVTYQATATTGLTFNVSNFELCYSTFSFGAGKITNRSILTPIQSIKTKHVVSSSKPLNLVSGSQTIDFSAKANSIRGFLFQFAPANQATAATGHTNWLYDSPQPVGDTNGLKAQVTIDGKKYPFKEIDTTPTGCANSWINELYKTATIFQDNYTNIYDKANEINISPTSAGYVASATPSTTLANPAKFFLSVMTDKLQNQNKWWSGMEATSNTISLEIQCQTASAIPINVVCHMVCDAYLELDHTMGTMALRY